MKLKKLHNCTFYSLPNVRACSCYNKLWHIQYMIPMQTPAAAYAQKVTALITVVLTYGHLTRQQVQDLAQTVKNSLAMKHRQPSMQLSKYVEWELQLEEHESDVEEHESDVEEGKSDVEEEKKQSMEERQVEEHESDVEEHELDVEEHESDVEEHESDVEEKKQSMEERQVEEQQETRKTKRVEEKVKESKLQKFVNTVSKIPFIYDIARISAFTAATLALLLTGSEPQGHALV